MNVPIITLEIQAMKHTIKTVLSEYATQIDAEIQASVDEFCTPENIKRLVQEAAKVAISNSIKDSVHSYFAYGKGKEQVAEAVREQLELKTEVEQLALGTLVDYHNDTYKVIGNDLAGYVDLLREPPLGRKGDICKFVRASSVTVVEG